MTAFRLGKDDGNTLRGGGGDSAVYKLYKYVRYQRVWFYEPFWSESLKTGVDSRNQIDS